MDAATLAVAIQHHPARADLLPRLLRDLRGLPVRIVHDPDPDGTRAPWRTYRCCLERGFGGAVSHLLVIQDDALAAPGFPERLRAAVAERPDSLVSLFTGRWPERTAIEAVRAQEAGESWAELLPGTWVSAVALVWPRVLAERLLGFVDAARWPAGRLADDEIIGRWCRAERITVAHRIPNPVEHPDDVPSLLNPYRKKRTSVVPWGRIER